MIQVDTRFFMFDMTEEDVVEFIEDFEPDDEFQKELTLIKQVYKENVWFVIIGILKVLDLNSSQIFVTTVVLDVSFQKQK